MPNRNLALAVTTSAITICSALALTGCSTSFSGDSHWDDAAAMRASTENASVPSLVEADAQDISLRVAEPAGTGTQLQWKSEKGIVRSDCKKGTLTGTSSAGASWWPTTLPTKGWTCGWWKAFTKDGTYYAWHDSTTTRGS